tara:strand:+ start:5757 stop:6155 length:399 start_codon:yes stop_codon:yes gene_type:complete
MEQTIYYMQESSRASSKWYDLLKEEDDPTYIHRAYEVEVDVRISKTKGGNKDQTLDDIRSIERVTTVTDPARAGHVSRARATDQYWFNRYVIKFELNSDLRPRYWVRRYLVADLAKIKGLNIVRWGEPVEVA